MVTSANSVRQELRNSLALFAIVTLIAACVNDNRDSLQQAVAGDAELGKPLDLGAIISSYSNLIMGLEDVVGIGEGLCSGTPCIRIFLARENAASVARIQEDLAGIPFAVEISGDFTALPK
jgi:hypothetical protein